MPFGSVKLIPGVNVVRTPTLLEASIATSQLIRFRDGLAQKYGGWERFYSSNVSGTPRALLAWQDLNDTDYLAVGTTTLMAVCQRLAPSASEAERRFDGTLVSESSAIVKMIGITAKPIITPTMNELRCS